MPSPPQIPRFPWAWAMMRGARQWEGMVLLAAIGAVLALLLGLITAGAFSDWLRVRVMALAIAGGSVAAAQIFQSHDMSRTLPCRPWLASMSLAIACALIAGGAMVAWHVVLIPTFLILPSGYFPPRLYQSVALLPSILVFAPLITVGLAWALEGVSHLVANRREPRPLFILSVAAFVALLLPEIPLSLPLLPQWASEHLSLGYVMTLLAWVCMLTIWRRWAARTGEQRELKTPRLHRLPPPLRVIMAGLLLVVAPTTAVALWHGAELDAERLNGFLQFLMPVLTLAAGGAVLFPALGYPYIGAASPFTNTLPIDRARYHRVRIVRGLLFGLVPPVCAASGLAIGGHFDSSLDALSALNASALAFVILLAIIIQMPSFQLADQVPEWRDQLGRMLVLGVFLFVPFGFLLLLSALNTWWMTPALTMIGALWVHRTLRALLWLDRTAEPAPPRDPRQRRASEVDLLDLLRGRVER